jgi:hypothetical protein
VLGDGYGIAGTLLSFEFSRAVAAGASSLAPGECAWVDRPVAAGEPSRICDQVEGASLDLQMAIDNRAVRAISSRSAPYLARLVLGDEILTFRVFNNGQGCLVATEDPAPARGRGRGRGRAL